MGGAHLIAKAIVTFAFVLGGILLLLGAWMVGVGALAVVGGTLLTLGTIIGLTLLAPPGERPGEPSSLRQWARQQ